MSFRDCTQVTAACPVEATIYGYYPNLPANATLMAVFAVLTVAQLVFGLWKKVYAFSLWVAVGCLLETLGYAGKLMLNGNPWSDAGNKLQIVCLVLGPTFVAAGVYLTLKHSVIYTGAEYSRLRPNLYTWIFIGCDIGSICVQAVGGGIAAAAGKTNTKLVLAGNNIIITGIAIQVATLVVCGILTTEYYFRQRRGKAHAGADVHSHDKREQGKVQLFQYAVMFAFLTILIRCVYRLPEMAGGWGNPRMRNEKEFLILDGLMIALASITLTVFHPGFYFPAMGNKRVDKSRNVEMSSRDESDRGVSTP